MCEIAMAARSEGVSQFVTSALAPRVPNQPQPTPKTNDRVSNVAAVTRADVANIDVRRHRERSAHAHVQASANTPMSAGA